MDYATARHEIKDGDLIAVKGRGLFAAVIRFVTQSAYTHTGIAVWIGGRLLVAETRGGVAAFSPASQHKDDDFDVFDCPIFRRPDVVEAALAILGAPIRYDYLDLVAILGHEVFGLPLPDEDGSLLCSALSAAIYKRLDWTPVGLPSIPTPRDVVAALADVPKLTVTARKD